ncbi:MAG: GldG family protein [bacterium]
MTVVGDASEQTRVPRALVERVGGVALVAGLGVLGNAAALWAFGVVGAPAGFMAVGALLVAGGLAAQARRLRGVVRSPALAMTGLVAAAAVLGVAALALVSVINARHFRRVDLTGSDLYTLHDQTVKILRSVERPLRIIGAMVPNPNPQSPIHRFNNAIRQRTDDLLREYAAQSPLVEFTPLDFYADPQAVGRLQDRYQVEILRDSVVFVYEMPDGDYRSKAFRFQDLAAHSPVQGVPPKFKGEAVFTSGLQALLEGAETRVRFLVGHGEKSVEEFDSDGLSDLGQRLRDDHCALGLCRLPVRPSDCDVLIVPGPRRAFDDDELEALRRYLEAGGGLIALLDPVVGDMASSGVEAVLADHGIRVETDLVVIEESPRVVRGIVGSTPSVRIEAAQYPKSRTGQGPERHPITEDLRRIRTVYHVACPVAAVPRAEGRADPYTVPLVASSPRSGAKRDFDPRRLESLKLDRTKDARGPFAIAVARGRWFTAEPGQPLPEPPPGRVVVFGDSDFATNGRLQPGRTGNATLLRNAVAWVAGREYKVGIPPKPLEVQRKLDVTEAERSVARWAAVFVPPFHILLVGIVVWWVRRR